MAPTMQIFIPAVVSTIDAWRRLLGVKPDSAVGFSQTHYYFAGGLGVRVAAAIAVAGALWFAVLYLIDGSRPSWLVKAPLVVLRLTALSALLLMLLQPMMRL